jgi:hypothetical protein
VYHNSLLLDRKFSLCARDHQTDSIGKKLKIP